MQAKNANDIKDVDQRATAGINNAMMAANTADQHAADAANKANAAQTTATGASARTDQLNGTVSNLDQYQPGNFGRREVCGWPDDSGPTGQIRP